MQATTEQNPQKVQAVNCDTPRPAATSTCGQAYHSEGLWGTSPRVEAAIVSGKIQLSTTSLTANSYGDLQLRVGSVPGARLFTSVHQQLSRRIFWTLPPPWDLAMTGLAAPESLGLRPSDLATTHLHHPKVFPCCTFTLHSGMSEVLARSAASRLHNSRQCDKKGNISTPDQWSMQAFVAPNLESTLDTSNSNYHPASGTHGGQLHNQAVHSKYWHHGQQPKHHPDPKLAHLHRLEARTEPLLSVWECLLVAIWPKQMALIPISSASPCKTPGKLPQSYVVLCSLV